VVAFDLDRTAVLDAIDPRRIGNARSGIVVIIAACAEQPGGDRQSQEPLAAGDCQQLPSAVHYTEGRGAGPQFLVTVRWPADAVTLSPSGAR
jgi:hypothetical protein